MGVYLNISLSLNIIQSIYLNISLSLNIIQSIYLNISLSLNIIQSMYLNISLSRKVIQSIYLNMYFSLLLTADQIDNVLLSVSMGGVNRDFTHSHTCTYSPHPTNWARPSFYNLL